MTKRSGEAVVDMLIERMQEEGGAMYAGEAVTQLQHALQAADLARSEGASGHLVVAALLHDFGHLLNDDDAVAAARGVDQFHEEMAANYLMKWFPAEVTEPIRMHVPAKRYLCAAVKGYFDSLSPASRQSLAVQGGTFSEAEAAAFIARPHAPAAVDLRRWDDLAKDPTRAVPGLGTYREAMLRALAAPAN
ncbi:MAG: metal-dependent phosphohydrolase [Rhizobiales bacterium]|nr:metal-dependent phosphohydrolase [Hyphomicrobiales bacterium]